MASSQSSAPRATGTGAARRSSTGTGPHSAAQPSHRSTGSVRYAPSTAAKAYQLAAVDTSCRAAIPTAAATKARNAPALADRSRSTRVPIATASAGRARHR
jgi:hypothetical protein